jgi:carboxylate-amine ligase
MDALISSQAIQSIREVWWDIRPHPGFGTVELRICDGLPTLDEIACVAALSQCLVERFDRQLDYGYTLPEPRPWLVRENKWRAARYGLDAEIVVDNTGRVLPLTTAITDLVEDLLPIASTAGLCRGARGHPTAHGSGCELSAAARRCGGKQRRPHRGRRSAAG